jgi:predicted dehydrogenase
MRKKRFALIGASNRGYTCYAIPLCTQFSRATELVAICDISQARMDFCNQQLPRSLPTYKDFDRMVKDVDFDTLIVVTMDCFHHEYIIRGLEAGKDVISEKPMTIDEEKCRNILAAEKKSGRKVTVTFNFRFTPAMTLLHRLVRDGMIGEIVTVDMHWPLDLSHGASYFHRWNGRRACSGGLQIHKSCHHFDAVNWILGDTPMWVSAQGGLAFYGKQGPFRSKRCTGCPHKDKCQFHWNLENQPGWTEFFKLQLAAEKETGYIVDGCVFAPEIDIEDHYSVMAKYKNGAKLSYSLQAWSPWEGMELALQGKKGRIEYKEIHSALDWKGAGDHEIVVMLNDGSRAVHIPPKEVGGHGGGDARMLQALFGPGHRDTEENIAGTQAACDSVLLGVAATKSMQNGNAWVSIPDLLKGT